MRDGEGSSTALGVSVIRATHQIVDDSPHILEDPISQRLLDDVIVEQIQRESEKYRSRQARGLRSHIVLRSRYAEDELREAVVRGVRQFVNLGAGYDTFSYRQPEWATDVQILRTGSSCNTKGQACALCGKGVEGSLTIWLLFRQILRLIHSARTSKVRQ